MSDWTDAARREALAETCLSLADLAETLTDAQWTLPTGCPGWSVHDQVAHVSSLEVAFSGAGEPAHTAPVAAYVRNSIGRRMEDLVDRRRDWTPGRLVDELRAVVPVRQAQLAVLDDEPGATLPSPTGRPLPLAVGIMLRVFDGVAHEQDVRRAVGRPGGLDGPAGALVAEQIPLLLQDAWAEQDGVVALDVGGVVTVLRLGTATGAPTVTIACDLAGLVALSTGRSDAPAPTVTGDEALGRALVAEFALTP